MSGSQGGSQTTPGRVELLISEPLSNMLIHQAHIRQRNPPTSHYKTSPRSTPTARGGRIQHRRCRDYAGILPPPTTLTKHFLNNDPIKVTFIGQIRNISTQATNITYKLDDGTGTIEVKQWIDVDASSDNSTKNQKPKLVENDYARVWGRLKAFNNKRHVGAHVIRPITDKMEITHHLLEATYVHLYFTRGPLDQASKSNEANVQDQAGGYGMNSSSTMMGNGRQMPNVSLGAKRVYETLANTPQNNEGLHVQNIAASVQMSVQDVMKAGDELLSHSMIYTTVDDNTWALLEF